jgi:hypothetical protein
MTPDTWTLSNLRSALQRVVSARSPYAWIVDLKPLRPAVIYGDGGVTYEASYAVAADGTITLGDATEVREQTVYWPAEDVAFSASPDATGRVVWSGLIFRAGRYPERPIREITEADLDAIVANFPASGVPILVDHNPRSFLSPALRKDGAGVRRVWRVGGELHGEVSVPGWFASAARDLWKSVSVGLDESLQRLKELSFVSNPRVTDAAVFGASSAFTLFAQAHPDLAANVRPPADPAPTPPTPIMSNKPSVFDRVRAMFLGIPADRRGDLTEQDLITAFSIPAPETPARTAPPPEDRAALEARIAALEASFAKPGAGQAAATTPDPAAARRGAALAFYAEQLEAGRVTPAERDQVLADHEAAQLADQAQTFSASQPESFQARLKTRYEARTPQFRLGGGQRINGADQGGAQGAAKGNYGFFSEADFETTFGARENK